MKYGRAFTWKLDIFTCENNMLSSHVKISPLLWLDNKSHLSCQKTIKVSVSTLGEKFRISARPCNILYLYNVEFTCSLRWLNTVLRAVSGNLHDGACFKLEQQIWWRKSNGTQKIISQNLLIKLSWYLAEFLLLSYLKW